MNKKLILYDADFSSVAINEHDLLYDKRYTTEELESMAINYPVDCNTGSVRTDLSRYKHTIIPVKGYSRIIITGTFPYHIGSFYSSTSIGSGTYVSCDNQLRKSDGHHYITRTVTVPANAVVVAINTINEIHDVSLQVKV